MDPLTFILIVIIVICLIFILGNCIENGVDDTQNSETTLWLLSTVVTLVIRLWS